jgi:RNA polymerase-binding transcription factor DksA
VRVIMTSWQDMDKQREREVRRLRTVRYALARRARRTGLICVECGETFDAERRDAKTCSNACRQAFHRRQRQ